MDPYAEGRADLRLEARDHLSRAVDAMEKSGYAREGAVEELVEMLEEMDESEGGASDPRPDPRTHPEFWRE